MAINVGFAFRTINISTGEVIPLILANALYGSQSLLGRINMNRSRFGAWHTTLAIASMSMFVASSPSRADDSIASEIEKLKEKIADLEARQKLNEDVIKSKVDAHQQGAIGGLGGGFTGGWDEGFKFKSTDGNYQLQPFGHFQFRYLLNSQSEVLSEEANIQDGFELARTRFGFQGHLFSPDLTFFTLFAAARDTGSVALEQAYIQYKMAENYQLRVGQWESEVGREMMVASTRQLGADRSLVNDVLGLGDVGFVQGVQLRLGMDKGPVRTTLAFTDGARSGGTNFVDSNGTNYGAQARIDYLFTGDWKDYRDQSAMNIKTPLLAMGVGLDYTEADAPLTSPATSLRRDTRNIYRHYADVTYKSAKGFGLLGAYSGRWTTSENGDLYDLGLLGQGSYVIPNTKWELFTQLGLVRLDSAPDTQSNDSFSQFTLGTTYYYHKQNAKMTLDLTYLPDGAPKTSTNFGSFASDESQFIIRGQFQFLF